MEVKRKQQVKRQKTFLKMNEMLFNSPFYLWLSGFENPACAQDTQKKLEVICRMFSGMGGCGLLGDQRNH